MNQFTWRAAVSLLLLSHSLSFIQPSHAHFPWIALDKQGHALLFFSESPTDRDYHLPESVLQAKVTAHNAGHKEPQPIEFVTLESGDVTGTRSKEPIGRSSTLSTSFTYGNYHGTLLKYYAQLLPPIGSKEAAAPSAGSTSLSASITATKLGMEVTVRWDGKPLAGAGVTIIDAEGEQFEDKTNADGKVSFSTQAAGQTGFVIAHVVKEKGEWEGKAHTSVSHYATVTTSFAPTATSSPISKKPSARLERPAAEKSSRYAPLPEAVASFGAAVCDGWLYVYSGHTGKAHDHSRDNLSEKFARLRLETASEWEMLPQEAPLQGLPLVTHGGKLYRVGGLSAENASGADIDLHSLDEFCCFDPDDRTWTALPKLPEGRSSHDAVVMGDRLFVVGGWRLNGGSDGEWLDTAWVFNLTDHDSSWQSVPSPPFRRRALAVAHWKGKVIALCGMGEDHSISRSVDCFDPATGEWSQLASFPGDEGMSGFGVSAWNAGGKLFACGSEGVVYQLEDTAQSWKKVAELNRPRFFHRLVARDAGELLVIGGAPLDDEVHLKDIEAVDIKID